MKFWRPESAQFLVAGVLVLMIVAGGWMLWQTWPKTISVRIESTVLSVRVAADAAARENSLKSYDTFDKNGGLLLAYPQSDRWKVAMKDVPIDLDIVWLDESRRVVHIVREAKVSDDPEKSFTPLKKARYVLELAAGTTKQAGITIGSTAIFTIDEAKN